MHNNVNAKLNKPTRFPAISPLLTHGGETATHLGWSDTSETAKDSLGRSEVEK